MAELSLSTFPTELIATILCNMGFYDLPNVRRVCQRWNAASHLAWVQSCFEAQTEAYFESKGSATGRSFFRAWASNDSCGIASLPFNLQY